ncbi:MAG: hypothetical protein QXD43_04285 [Candidatus Aenigmatarchaeota archaeon]
MSAIIDNSLALSFTFKKEQDGITLVNDEEEFEGISLPINFKDTNQVNDFIKELEKFDMKIYDSELIYDRDGYLSGGKITIGFNLPKKISFLSIIKKTVLEKRYITLRSRTRYVHGSVSSCIEIGVDGYCSLEKPEKIVIDYIIRNSSLGKYLIEYWKNIKRISEEEARKRLERITPLAPEYIEMNLDI